MRIKICGITNFKDAFKAYELGAWALGFNFYPKSPRYITPSEAQSIIQFLPSKIEKIGIFVKSSAESIERTINEAGLTAIQLYDCEPAQYSVFTINCHYQDNPQFGDIFLLDTQSPHFGGTGIKSNWDRAAQLNLDKPIILAGGITPENIKEALNKGSFFALDICSGVESEHGIKSFIKMEKLFTQIKESSCSM